MRGRRGDAEEWAPFRSILATIATAFVDHRLFFQIVIAIVIIFSLRLWGPEEVQEGFDAVAATAPIREAGRAVAAIWQIGFKSDHPEAAPPVESRAPSTGASQDAAGPPPPSTTGGPVGGSGGTSTSASDRSSSPTSVTRGQAQSPPPTSSVRQSPAAGADRRASNAPEAKSQGAHQTTQNQKADVLWSMRKDALTVTAEVREGDDGGSELRLLRNGEVWRVDRWKSRAAAVADANAQRDDLAKRGWTAVTR